MKKTRRNYFSFYGLFDDARHSLEKKNCQPTYYKNYNFGDVKS